MLIQEIIDIFAAINRPGKVGQQLKRIFAKENIAAQIKEIKGKKAVTEFVKIIIPGTQIKKSPTLGIIGRLGGIGARPSICGFVSDGDGALTVLSAALRLTRMRKVGDLLRGNIIITTQLCTNAPILPRKPVPFMDAAVSSQAMNKYEIDQRMDAILSVDTTRGNRIIKTNTFAITPTVKDGWILKVADDLLTIMEYVTDKPPSVMPITMQDITPYGNGIYHINSILQPSVVTSAPVVGIAITSKTVVPGCMTGVTNIAQIDQIGRFIIEVAQAFTKNNLSFYDQAEFKKLEIGRAHV